MEYRIPKKGDIYRHFKGNLYEIVVIARDSETLEEKVVYKEVEGEAAFVRSLPMFVGLVDKEKYPDVTQEFRFELVQEADSLSKELCKEVATTKNANLEQEIQIGSQDMIMEYLEQENVDDKIDYLIRVVAQSLDFVENKGDLLDRYDEILRYLRTVAKYESGRLR